MAEIIWTLAASQDLQNVFESLETVRPGAGEAFVMNAEARLELVKQFPRMNRLYFPPFRKLRLIGNYGLFYATENRGIVVHAVVDLRKDMSNLRRRLLGEE